MEYGWKRYSNNASFKQQQETGQNLQQLKSLLGPDHPRLRGLIDFTEFVVFPAIARILSRLSLTVVTVDRMPVGR